MTTQETTLRIEGMHCEGCTRRITNVLERLDGVRSAEVSLQHGTARVEHDADAVNVDRMKAAVEKAGYAAVRG